MQVELRWSPDDPLAVSMVFHDRKPTTPVDHGAVNL